MDRKKELLNEALKRHKQLLEYSFFVSEEGDKPSGEDTENLIFGGQEDLQTEQEEEPVEEPTTEEPTTEEPTTEEPDAATTTEDPFGGATPVEDEMATEPEETTGENQVEVDVTDIVDKAEEAKEQATQASSKIDELLSKFSELEEKLGGMDAIISKMDEIEKEVIQRNPTPVEKLNLRSLDSFPYSVKLSDFWAQKEGYSMDEEENEKTDFTLTSKDIEKDYDETKVKDSFKR